MKSAAEYVADAAGVSVATVLSNPTATMPLAQAQAAIDAALADAENYRSLLTRAIRNSSPTPPSPSSAP